MKLSGSRAYVSPTPVPKMPAGLVELMEGLTKEVLRCNPTDVFEFCAEHMKKLLELRDGRPPDRYLTLEKKFIKATNIVRQRAKQRRQKYDKEMQLYLRQDSLSPHHPSETKKIELKWDNDLTAQSLLKLEGVSKVIKNDNVNNFDLNNTECGNCNQDISTEIYSKEIKDEDTVEKLSNKELVSADIINYHSDQKQKPYFHVNNIALDVEKHGINKSDRKDTSNPAENMVDDTKHVDKIENTESFSVTNIYNIKGVNGELEKIETLVKNYSNDKPVLTENKNVVIPADTVIDQNVEENLKAVNNIYADESISDVENKEILNLVEKKFEKSAVSNAEVCQEIMKVYKDDKDDKEQINDDQNAIAENKFFESDYTYKDTDIVTDNKENTVCDEVNNQLKEGNLSSDIGEVEIMDAKCLQKETFGKEYKDGINTDPHDVISINTENPEIKAVITPNNYAEIEIKPVINNDQFLPDSKLNINENYSNVENANGRKSENKSESEALKMNNGDLLDTSNVAINANEAKVQIVNKLSPQFNKQNIDNATSDNFVEINTNEDSTQCLSKTYLREEGNNKSTENSEMEVIKEDVYTDNPLLCESNNSSFMLNSDCNINDKDNSDEEVLSNTTCVVDEASESKRTKAMDLETAAITIQKVFRNFLFRNKTSSFDESTNMDFNRFERENNLKDEEITSKNQNINKDRRTLGISRMDTVLQTVNEEKSLSVSTDDSSTLSSAATVIQAHVRGFLVRNRLNRNKTISNTTLVDSDDPSMSLETPDPTRNKTVLNIHIVPDGSQFMSRDESLLTSVELSLDGSPPTSTNLHPLGYDKNERRKQLKREDAIQSISPPSNSCSRLSEELDSAKELSVNDNSMETEQKVTDEIPIDSEMIVGANSEDILLKKSVMEEQHQNQNLTLMSDFKQQAKSEISSDESDVITPFVPTEENNGDSDNTKLLHSGEFHDLVLPTKVSRNDTSVVRDFQNVLVYFLVWNNS